MQLEVIQKLSSDKQMSQFLQMNSQWYKYLNRNPIFYKTFSDAMKEKYKIRATDKMNDLVENIDLISSILGVLK